MNRQKTVVKSIFLLLLTLITVTACNKKPQFTVEGIIENADSTTLYLEKRDFNGTILLDSVHLDKEGKFSFKSDAPQYPELYVLRIGRQVINLGIDSTETITVQASKNSFAENYNIEGSDVCSDIKMVTLEQYKLSKTMGDLAAKLSAKLITEQEYTDQLLVAVDEYKALALKIIAKAPQSLAAYYALFQKVGDYLIFDPYDKKESKYFGAVATQWDFRYKDSPRTKHLYDFTLSAIKTQRDMNQSASLLNNIDIQDASTVMDIDLINNRGQSIKLSSLKGKVVILDFTAYQSEYSPAHNALLNKIYGKYRERLEIYQVSFDQEMHLWNNATTNLPWVCVKADNSQQKTLLQQYNIQSLPTTYILNKDGDIVKRVIKYESMDAELSKLL
ncbi:cytochrome oxidase Cu insertion factor (SCO1/SenC/PrrC family) [Dysgonomonas sp. PH5-45]|uniref:thioredoxin-like domain-containing protein n=1 Tax=unclassified Dysgonomonas TaxID=2630389 RepID=UPI002473A526|nr:MULTISPECIES: thioredoxin-like domain-containing protein [unclassified Dysgonomonas]MDH6354219.1 cytochrome oxidase Cu insertion factor (SCO1/SenC/PrrC family) [Dysgonomonas sp. PH5-45]MDH6387120.1 cytochrome oxidase Cu insertion factor (SCO1/SenC/PrrC family) [Dysgonomonas sp. PH5-37]